MSEPGSCPHCGRTIESRDAFCPECGRTTSTGARIPSTNCANCGMAAEPQDTFCSECGQMLKPETAAHPRTDTYDHLARPSGPGTPDHPYPGQPGQYHPVPYPQQ